MTAKHSSEPGKQEGPMLGRRRFPVAHRTRRAIGTFGRLNQT
jgi:hypothetical protein